jgi:hypothetical protein
VVHSPMERGGVSLSLEVVVVHSFSVGGNSASLICGVRGAAWSETFLYRGSIRGVA